ncbi:MAG: crossover junction endodeoxyribonuclease RuvC [Candidatus Margulisbacteria bacterium]|nr:crossover junction endodeoxyribonuclease RuvC [Candidatus Margulisiibacteriota bacterium]MBU1022394.1 crossover junction endodeoxyribonuclease RuvC [Candidatus Margulisiibacteriota bacterium]MBU1729054.1 crossover junction endodeoxyribonuclease RuvC [Candidatus Margulisiibacteriota bacterium]MBU1954525.1 crossover junction endodeoxyribonuclease RuvC [Candidatus Margulisiibacteriota bacterium]
MIILGIDPGTATTGFGVIRKLKNSIEYIACGCIRTSSKLSDEKRLSIINQEFRKLIKQYKPNQVAVEKLFFGDNAKTAMVVGQARGVILLGAADSNLPLAEYTPLQVKIAITGYGRAVKSQIQQMVKVLLKLDKIPKPDDAADALAIAICHAHTLRV